MTVLLLANKPQQPGSMFATNASIFSFASLIKSVRRLYSQPMQRLNVHKALTLFLQATLLVGAILSTLQGRWLTAAVTTAIIIVTLLPLVLGRRFNVRIPPEFEFFTVIFVYSSLFLGEVHGYYIRYWWWDAVLHTGSGFLLGVLGFLLVYVMNERPDVDIHMRPRFVAMFAFMFAVGMGALWEIFEFGIDQLFGMNMQKSGLIDTMWDLIVDTVGAAVIALLGWVYMRTAGTDSFLERWITGFIRTNPRLFNRNDHAD